MKGKLSRILSATCLFFLAISCQTDGLKEIKEENKFIFSQPLLITPPKKGKDNHADFDYNILFEEAGLDFDKKNFVSAEAAYMAILSGNPEYPNTPYCYYNLGLIMLIKKDFPQAEAYFKSAFFLIPLGKDKLDAFLLYLDTLKRQEKWKEITYACENAFTHELSGILFENEEEKEILLRYYEAVGLAGDPEKARQGTLAVIAGERIHGKDHAAYNPVLAQAYFVLGTTWTAEFSAIPFSDSLEVLTEKCRLLLEAQKWYLQSVRTGIIYWTNASAFENAEMYEELFLEINTYPVPSFLDADEQIVYQCELWKKTAGLLRKARKTLEKNIAAAERMKEANEYTEGSAALLRRILVLYQDKENECQYEDTSDETKKP